MYFTFQNENLKLLEENLDSNLIYITGKKHSGISYVVKHLGIENLIVLEVKPANQDLASIQNAILANSEFKNKIRRFQISFSLGAYGGVGINPRIENLKNRENYLEKLLKKNCNRHTVILLVKNFDDIDERSKLFLNYLSNNINKYKKRLYIIIKGDNLPYHNLAIFNNYTKIRFLDVCFDFREFAHDVNKQLNRELNNDELSFIYHNIDGNINLLNKIISSLNQDCDNTFNTPSTELNSIVESLIENKIDRDTVLKSLKFISIIEEGVHSNDLAFLLSTKNNIIDDELKDVENKKIIEFNNKKWDFTFKILRKIFVKKSQKDIMFLYNKIVELYRELYPSKYERLFYYSKKLNSKDCIQYYVQDILKNIRKNPIYVVDENELNNTIQNTEKKSDIIEFIKNYHLAWNMIANDEFDNAKKILLSTTCSSGYLLLEKNLILSQCLTKSLNANDRVEAVNLLKLDYTYIDKNLEYRCSVRKIAALVHIGEYEQAKIIFSNLLIKLEKNYEENKSPEIKEYINIIKRRSNNVNSCDISELYMKEAVSDYESNKSNPIGYYISLCNLFAISLLNYDLKLALEVNKKIKTLKMQFSKINFPRQYIYENDLILFEYFKKEISSEIAEKRFLALTESCKSNKDRADNIFFRSNYAVFMAINGNLDQAIAELEKEKLYKDKEGIYDLRIVVNLAIFKYIKNNSNRKNCLKKLQNLKLNFHDPDFQWMRIKIDKIKEIIQTRSIKDVNDWIKSFEISNEQSSPDPLYYYGKPFVYTTVFNWDDD